MFHSESKKSKISINVNELTPLTINTSNKQVSLEESVEKKTDFELNTPVKTKEKS